MKPDLLVLKCDTDKLALITCNVFYLLVSVLLAYDPSCKAHSINIPGQAKFCSLWNSQIWSEAAQIQSVCG